LEKIKTWIGAGSVDDNALNRKEKSVSAPLTHGSRPSSRSVRCLATHVAWHFFWN